jgi:diguanylate cyclase (GGDEF)-like protein
MKIRDQELLALLRAFGSKVRGSVPAIDDAQDAGADDAVGLLGLPEHELTPKVRSALGHLIDEVAELRHELLTTQRRLMELERLADEDSLAPISNRRAFLRDLARTIKYVERYGAACSLLYFDVNGLKSINDTHGHAAGDAALIHVADILRSNTRTSDVVGRLGGDEFGVLLARANEAIATSKAHQLARVVADQRFTWDGRTVAISVAFGAHGLSPGEDPQEALTAADRAMYRQKHAHRRQRAEQAVASGDDVG